MHGGARLWDVDHCVVRLVGWEVSGQAMVEALIAGQAHAATMVEVAHGRMQSKLPVLGQALMGVVREPHRRLLALQ